MELDIKMNKYKKRLIRDWKQHGSWILNYIHSYRGKGGTAGSISDLKHACSLYVDYVNIYLTIWEHNI